MTSFFRQVSRYHFPEAKKIAYSVKRIFEQVQQIPKTYTISGATQSIEKMSVML